MDNTNIYQTIFDQIHASEKTRQRILNFCADTAAKSGNRTRKIQRRFIPAAAAIAILFLTGMVTYAAIQWNGFLRTEGFSKDKIDQLLHEAVQVESAATDPEGNVHYYDRAGKEIMVLSPEEQERYQEECEQRKLEEFQRSSSRADITTFWPEPSGVTELPLSPDGNIPDFILGNGHMIILYPEEADGFSLHSGDRLTVKINSNDDCYLAFYVIKDRKNQDELSVVDHTQNHSFTFDVTEDGEYCIAMMYYSAAASNFTDGRLQIETAPTAACEVPLLPADL